MIKLSVRYLFFALIILISSCNSQQVSEKNSVLIKETLLPKFKEPSKSYIIKKQRYIHSFFKEHLNPNSFSGQFLVAKNGKVIYCKAEGYANWDENQFIDLKTPMHVASVSKVATALAVLRLVDQGKIRLDEDIRTYLPEIPYEGISVRMCMNHRSGIPYYGYFTHSTWKLGKTLRNSDMLKLIIEHKFPLNFVPDSKFAYCNTNYALLALIIENVTEQKFPKAMQSLVFEPLKMKNTFILKGKKMYVEASQSYNSKHEIQQFDYLDAIYGDKNMYTTAGDLVKMDLGTYSNSFISDSLISQMFKGYSYEKPGKSNYGLGIRMKEESGKKTYFFHTGWWHGNTACYASLRSDTVCIIALSNVFTKSVYRINRLSIGFGNYPFNLPEE